MYARNRSPANTLVSRRRYVPNKRPSRTVYKKRTTSVKRPWNAVQNVLIKPTRPLTQQVSRRRIFRRKMRAHGFRHKRTKGPHPTVTFSRSGKLLPDIFNCKTSITRRFISTTNATSAPNWETYLLNSWFDPLGTLDSPKPIGYNELILFYSRYYVTGAKVTIRWYTVDPEAPPIICSVGFNSAQTTPPATVDLCESLPNYQNRYMNDGQGKLYKFSKYYSCPVMVDVNRKDYSDLANAPVTANPAFPYIANLDIGFTAFDNTACAYQAEITITQYVTLYGVIDLTSSGLEGKLPDIYLVNGLVVPRHPSIAPSKPLHLNSDGQPVCDECDISSDSGSSVSEIPIIDDLSKSQIEVIRKVLKK